MFQGGHINAGFVPAVTSPSFALNTNMTKMDSLDSTASSLRDQAQISAVHAASLNGDKSSLAKLLVCTFPNSVILQSCLHTCML